MFRYLLCSFLILTAGRVFPQSLDLTIRNYGLSIGNSRKVNGIRINYRDHGRVEVNGINMTLWTAHENVRGYVNGLALGLPLTSGDNIHGIATGVFGVGAERSIIGISVAPIGVGAGGNLIGITVAGIGAGTGGTFTGIGVAGIGFGSGSNLEGLMLAGVGLGSGGSIKGIAVGGIGLGSGDNIDGIAVGLIGAGAGGDITGIAGGGIGLGAGGDMTGLFAGGVGLGCGGELKGIALAGVGVGAPKITGITASLAAGTVEFQGVALSPGYFRIDEEGVLKGVSVSAFNHIKGENSGLSIGIINFAEVLSGVQLGLINIAKSNPSGLKVLPIFNANFD